MTDRWLPVLLFGAVIVAFLVFAALHDISRAEQTGYTFEFLALLLCVPAFGFLYRKSAQLLTAKGEAAWLAVTGVIVTLFNVAAAGAVLRPKYGNDRIVGLCFLPVGLTLLAFLCLRAVRLGRRRLTAS